MEHTKTDTTVGLHCRQTVAMIPTLIFVDTMFACRVISRREWCSERSSGEMRPSRIECNGWLQYSSCWHLDVSFKVQRNDRYVTSAARRKPQLTNETFTPEFYSVRGTGCIPWINSPCV